MNGGYQSHFCRCGQKLKIGAIRELNPGPPVPKTGIIPLDQSPLVLAFVSASLYNNYANQPSTVSIDILDSTGSPTPSRWIGFSLGSMFSRLWLVISRRAIMDESSETIDSSLM